MRRMRTDLVVKAVLLCVAVGLAACGGGKDSGGSGYGASSAKPTQDTTPAKVSGDLVPPGTKLALGKQATVGWVPPSLYNSTGTGPKKAIPLNVKVEGIEKGTPADVKSLSVSGAPAAATPYFVKVHITNLGTTSSNKVDDPGNTLKGFDDRGQPQPSVTIIGDFKRCPSADPPAPFTRGKSYDTCLTFLVGGGGSIEELRWNDGPAAANAVSDYYDKPVVWRG